MEKDDSIVNFHPPSHIPGVGVFESLEKRFSPVKQETVDMKKAPNSTCTSNKKNHYWKCTSSNKRLKSPPSSPPSPSSPSSPSLRQSKLTEESFSPKKMCAINAFSRQEQPVAYSAPLHCSVPLGASLHGADCDPGLGKNFTETQMNSLQALKEESFQQTVLTTVSSFMSQSRKPPPALVFYLLKDILLSEQCSCSKQCYRLLKEIQVLHPVAARQMISQKITWEFISMLVRLSKCTVIKFQSGDSSLAVNALLALSFLISVMEDEVKVKTFSHVRTSAHRLLNVVKWANHIQDVISWIEEATLQHCFKRSNHGCMLDMCPAYLLQRMLMLSLTVSERPEDCSSRIAGEMILAYCQMPSLGCKTLLLQSMQSPLLRAKLIEIIVRNFCPLQQDHDNAVPRSGLRHIIFVDFRRSPPGLIDGVSLSESVDSCEEFIMLHAYWLQSLVFSRKRSLQRNTSGSFRTLSMDDGDALTEIDQNVVKLRARLEKLCNPSKLSQRSYQLLDLISSLQSFAPKIPVVTAPYSQS